MTQVERQDLVRVVGLPAAMVLLGALVVWFSLGWINGAESTPARVLPGLAFALGGFWPVTAYGGYAAPCTPIAANGCVDGRVGGIMRE